MKKEKELKDLENTEDVEGGISLNKHPICNWRPKGNISHPLCDYKPKVDGKLANKIKSRSIKGKL